MTSLRKVLYKYKEQYTAITDNLPSTVKGKWFETICLYFFKHDPLYQQRFDEIWFWIDWPERNNRPDNGIDLVARRREDGKFCAIQCKFYEPEYSISKPDIDTFLAESGKIGFVERIIVSTTDSWNKNALNSIKNQQIPCNCIPLDNLEHSPIDWSHFDINSLDKVSYLPAKKLREDQFDALNAVINGFKNYNRGKIIMACGTGKTFTSLKITEKIAGLGKKVLFLIPSIALLNQTLLAWSADRDRNIDALFFAVCSDSTVGHNEEDIKISDLALPATTNVNDLMTSWNNLSNEIKEISMTVIFSTYQSLQVISKAQNMGFPDFDLVICDEAHRTTGVTIEGNEDSDFTKIHDNNYIKASKRLYMTATPKIYSAALVRKASEKKASLFSMDDENLYGPEFYRLSFSQAVKLGLLSDYKVMILAVYDSVASRTITAMQSGEVNLDDASKIIGCWKGLSKQLALIDSEAISSDPKPMRSAVAFSSTIKNSERFRDNFSNIIKSFNHENHENIENLLNCEVHHVDGKQTMSKRLTEISWLKEFTDNNNDKFDNSCRILSNARCLSEGVDIPALDAILFLNPRKSEIDIVQSVGRVMRRAPGKKFGYVILPVVIPGNMSPDEALDKNENYKIVWQVLQALRAHDDNFNAIVNSLDLNKKSDKIITSVIGGKSLDDDNDNPKDLFLPIPPEDWRDAVYVRIVQKCGDREYWDKWARDMARIAQAHTTRIQAISKTDYPAVKEIFKRYVNGLKEIINNSITQDEAIDMLSQHLITKPVFDAIFSNQFSSQNPISRTMEAVLDLLASCGLESETEALKDFYKSVKEKVELVHDDAGKQKVMKDLYERFFQIAFPRTSERLGIVYTPNEVVDFILRSADWALKNEFDRPEGLSSKNVHILDPFTGTGTFIVRLIQLGLIAPDVLEYKYKHEIHANEILLLAYYIATVNIETAYHSVKPDSSFETFPGIVLTDTFNMYDSKEHQFDFVFQENNNRAENQRKTPITVIVGNPPYSVGQTSANDNNQNLKYKSLDDAITNSYAFKSTATNKNSLYDSYIRAIRWASDRITEHGIICYVTNGSFLDSNSADGLRKCLYDEFQSIYIFNLRGNAYTQGEIRRKEGGNVFDSGSRLPVAITLMIKNPEKAGQKCKIYYYAVDDYMKRDEKLRQIEYFSSFGDMLEKLTEITPNENGDWINQRSKIFEGFLRLGNKKEQEQFAIFEGRYSAGIKTNRDAWCYNFSYEALKTNIVSMIDVYNHERERWHMNEKKVDILDFVVSDSRQISWDSTLYRHIEKTKNVILWKSRCE